MEEKMRVRRERRGEIYSVGKEVTGWKKNGLLCSIVLRSGDLAGQIHLNLTKRIDFTLEDSELVIHSHPPGRPSLQQQEKTTEINPLISNCEERRSKYNLFSSPSITP
ncbi:hypothetical protein NPIL_71941 [Nephila pilipes]|uniref:Uncharacterized protein n=1 Tax=Nephila pilipes TaxID=299642 RepID=A0A8X6NIP5_NEPPI|nr:hypothetical protein NPIL_71941 [Nephila pilipes]